MSTPLPIPSKVAVRALRGLALGTSCVIGVIVEDRRRRISTLRTAISNHKKLRSARNYHGNVDDVSIPPGESLQPSSGDGLQGHQKSESLGCEGESRVGSPSSRRSLALIPYQDAYDDQAREAGPAESAEHLPPREASPSSLSQAVPPSAPPSPSPAETCVPSQHKTTQWPSSSRPLPGFSANSSWPSVPPSARVSISELRQRSTKSIAVDITNLLDGNDEESLSRAVSKFCDTSRTDPPNPVTKAWVNISARLSRECQASGRWEDASRVLATTLGLGPLEEGQYYAHDPLPIVEFYLQPPDPDTPCSLEAIALASKFLLAKFKEKPRSHGLKIERLGRKLIRQALMMKQFTLSLKVYWLVLGLLEDAAAFAGWVIRQLVRYADYKNAIKCFLLSYSKMNPEEDCFNKTVGCVVESVQAMNGLKANSVFHAFERMNCPADGRLRSLWVMKLLLAHWHRDQDLAKSKALFDEITSRGILDKISHPEAAYRTMVEICVKANEEDMARSYYREVTQKYPYMISDITLRGFMAVLDAKAGDWSAVHENFVKMYRQIGERQEEYDDAFVMMLKIFAEDHPVADVRNLVEEFSSFMGVRMHRYIVTLVANKYAQCHDTAGFVSWLKYCCEAGFGLDSSFCNSALHSCQSTWKFPFPALQKLYLDMEKLNPNFPNDTTHRIMSQAERLSNPFRRLPGHRVRPRVVSVDRLAYLGRTTNSRDVYEAMNQEMRQNRPISAVAIYKRATKFGMPFCSQCLRLAVYAALHQPRGVSNSALLLIRGAFEQGHDVGAAVSSFIKIQIDRLQAGPEDVIIHMRNLISEFEALHIVVDASVMTHMAVVCVKIGQQEKAVALCKLAMDKRGSSNLCFSRQSFRALLMAYSQMFDFEGMKQLITDLAESQLASDRTVFSHLKGTKRLLQNGLQNNARLYMQEIIQHGIDLVRQRREEQRKDGHMISKMTLQIMGEALADMRNSNGDDNDNGGEDDDDDMEPSYPDEDISDASEDPTVLAGYERIPPPTFIA